MWLNHPAIAAAAPMVAALAMAAAAPALGADAPAKPPETAAPAGKESPPMEKLICTSEVATGSVMNKRVCKTQKQIDEDRKTAKEMKQQLGSGNGGISGDRPSSIR